MRAMWWILTVGLTFASVLLIAFGVRQLDAAPPTAESAEPSMSPAAPTSVAADPGQQRSEVMKFGRTTAVRLLGYTPQNAERELTAAVDELTTDPFRDEYTELIEKVIVPAASREQVTSEVELPAIAVESLEPRGASLLVFVDIRTTMGNEKPSTTSNSMRMKLEKVGDSWLVAALDPL